MFLDKVLSLLIYPLGFSLCLAVAGHVLHSLSRRRLAFTSQTVSILWLAFWSLPPVADAMTSSLERSSIQQPAEFLPRADVILVLGGGVSPSPPGQPYPDLLGAADRVWHAARLYHAGKAGHVILSGGRSDWHGERMSSSEAMAFFLRDLGVPGKAIHLESRSRTTYENAFYSKILMEEKGFGSALLVTSALHMPRSFSVFQAADIDVIPAPTDFIVPGELPFPARWIPNSHALDQSTRALHEWVGIAVYRWRGWM